MTEKMDVRRHAERSYEWFAHGRESTLKLFSRITLKAGTEYRKPEYEIDLDIDAVRLTGGDSYGRITIEEVAAFAKALTDVVAIMKKDWSDFEEADNEKTGREA